MRDILLYVLCLVSFGANLIVARNLPNTWPTAGLMIALALIGSTCIAEVAFPHETPRKR